LIDLAVFAVLSADAAWSLYFTIGQPILHPKIALLPEGWEICTPI